MTSEQRCCACHCDAPCMKPAEALSRCKWDTTQMCAYNTSCWRVASGYWQSTQTLQHAQANATRSHDSAYAMLAVMSLPAVARQTDVHILTPAQLLEDSMGSPLEDHFDPPVDDAATGRYAHTLRTRAVAWVRAAARQLRQLSSSAPPIATPASAPERRLNTSLIASRSTGRGHHLVLTVRRHVRWPRDGPAQRHPRASLHLR